MAQVIQGRFTAEINDEFVVFLIGMRVNQFWALKKWIPTARAMQPMLNSLHRYPEKGFLGMESFYRFSPLESILVTYWKSYEHLEYFARNQDDPHLEAWRQFNQRVGQDGSVGIWHETYLIQPGQYESIYANMPVFGLAAATKHMPIGSKRETARCRLGGNNEPAVSSS